MLSQSEMELKHIKIIDLFLQNEFKLSDCAFKLFCIAFESNNFDVANFLKSKIDNFKNENEKIGQDLVFHYTHLDNSGVLQWLLKNGAKICDNSGSLLWEALEKYSTLTVELLIQNGANCQYKRLSDSFVYNGLLTPAIARKELSVVELLMEKGALPDLNFRTPLVIAIFGGDINKAIAMIKDGAKLPSNKTLGGQILHIDLFAHAMTIKNFDLIFALLDAGLNIDIYAYRMNRFFTPLSFAIYNKNISAINKLLQRGARTEGAMNEAISNGSEDIVNLLKKYGAKLDNPIYKPYFVKDPNTEMALARCQINSDDKKRGLSNPLDKALWLNRTLDYFFIKKTGLFKESKILSINYNNYSDITNHFEGCHIGLVNAIEMNDINAVKGILEYRNTPYAHRSCPYYLLDSHSANILKNRVINMLIELAQKENSIPRESAELFIQTLPDMPIIFSNYNLELMELGLKYNKKNGSCKF